MTWLRNRLRAWLGITALDARIQLLQNEVAGFKQMAAQVLAAQAEVNTRMHEVNEVREAIQDPKHRPVIAKTMRQYRALMEQD